MTATYSVRWQDDDGLTRSAEVQAVDYSHSGVAFQCPAQLQSGTAVFLQGLGGPAGHATVRHCTRRDSGFTIGVELADDAKGSVTPRSTDTSDYYDLLQISPKAEFATIQRVYRFLAARYHPDNPVTGDSEKFLSVKNAYEVLSDPGRRTAYDSTRERNDPQPNPTLESINYMDGIEGEVNRRLAVLSLLYSKRRTTPEDPRVPLGELERRMGFPREYLDFATWYLRSKKFITKEDNSDFALTALGVDYVEANASQIPVLYKMLHASHGREDRKPGPRIPNEVFQLVMPSAKPGDLIAPDDETEN